jgi:regulator of sigma E protease
MDYIIYFIITIGVLVFVHEFGHFAAAKLSGMRADVFAIGFGKRLFGWNKLTRFTFGPLPKDFDGQGNTDYRVCLLPLGGYVKIAGMVDESFDTKFAEKEPQPYEFRSKPALKKLFVISAGVLMNLLLAVLIFWGSHFFMGKLVTKTTTIGYVETGSITDEMGFMNNDKILSVNGSPVSNWREFETQIFINTLGEDLIFRVERNGSIITLDVPRSMIPEESDLPIFIPAGIRPLIDSVLAGLPADQAGLKKGDILLKLNNKMLPESRTATQLISSNPNVTMPLEILRGTDTLILSITPSADGKIGVYITNEFTVPVEFITYGFFESFYMAGKDIVYFTNLTFSMLGKVFSGTVEFGKAFGGPIKIAQFAAKSADTGVANFLYFLALLSLSLAIINIMPFPVLDGGHLIIIIVEAILRKEIPVKVKIAIQNAGFVLLLLLFVFLLYNDILNW